MPKTAELTVERLREILSYDPKTGIFTWKVRSGEDRATRSFNGQHAGKIAGCVRSDGYHLIKIDGTLYLTSRLAHLFMTGTHPSAEIDHRNRERGTNRYSNLRPATRQQNTRNNPVRRTNKLGVKGIRLQRGKYRARIRDDARRFCSLGCFAAIEDAIAAYNKAGHELHGEFFQPSIDPANQPPKVRIVKYTDGPLPEPRYTIGPGGEVGDISFVRYEET